MLVESVGSEYAVGVCVCVCVCVYVCVWSGCRK